jgi:3-methyladenine DNA glycosylase AlkD
VDEVAQHLIGDSYMKDRERVAPLMDEWIVDPNLWIRRAAIISQNRHKAETDHVRLYDYCLRSAEEKDFFIRKAIGWALRDYSYIEPESVHEFLKTHRKDLSNLSFKEGSRILIKNGWSFEEA